ncbi:MAG: hypothetical protein A4E53_00389 [Pelotomaculum sp. PtaB.Bin104]|nr:MAG: hypothetical protein A4E53_00389 [Pelotomaculum sp. PtaB.Bin104]
MIKRLIAFAAVFLFLFAAYSRYSFAELYNPDDAKANALAGSYYTATSNGMDISYVPVSTLTSYKVGNNYFGALVYGSPHGDYKNGEYRFLGYTWFGDDYTNIGFPPDSYANGAVLEKQQWIPEPWNNVPGAGFNPTYDGTMKFYQNLRQGMLMYYSGGTNINGYTTNGDPNFWDNIQNYVHILAPPTQYAWGLGRMWHNDSDGNLWYLTVPIMPSALLPNSPPPAPEYPDYLVISADSGVTGIAEAGKKYMAKFVVSQSNPNFNSSTQPVVVKAFNNGVKVFETTETVPYGSNIEHSFWWDLPENVSEVKLDFVINLLPKVDEGGVFDASKFAPYILNN